MRERQLEEASLSNNARVVIGPPMSPEEEATHQRHLAEQVAEEAERGVEVMETKLAGIKKSLTAAKTEAKRLRIEVNRRKGEHGLDEQ